VLVSFGFVKFSHAPLKAILVSGKGPDGFQSNTCNNRFKTLKKDGEIINCSKTIKNVKTFKILNLVTSVGNFYLKKLNCIEFS
jgi:hypothetical protein